MTDAAVLPQGRAATVEARTAVWWVAVYLALGLVVVALQPLEGASPWYPPLAVGAGMLWWMGPRWWPIVLAADLPIALLQYPGSPQMAVVVSVTTTAEAVVLAVLLRRARVDSSFPGPAGVLQLTLASVAAALAGATIGTLLCAAVTDGGGSLWRQWQLWFVGDATGLVVFLPAVVLLTAAPGGPWAAVRALGRRSPASWVPLVATAFVVATLAFDPALYADQPLVRGTQFLVVLPVMWAAVFHDLLMTVLVNVVVDVTATLAYSFGSSRVTTPLLSQIPLELFLASVSLGGLLVAVTLRSERRSRDQMRHLVTSSPLAIIATDRDGRVRSWNAESERMFGYREDEVLGRPPPVFGPGNDSRYWERQRQVLDGHPIQDLAVRYVDRDRQTVHARLFASPVRDDDGQVDGAIALILDTSRERTLEGDLAREVRERDATSRAIARLSPEADVAATAAAIVREVVRLDGFDGAAILHFHRDGTIVPLATLTPPELEIVPGEPLPRWIATHVRTWADQPTWVGTWTEPDDQGRVISRSATGITAVAYARIRTGTRVVGALVCLSRSSDGARWIESRRSTAAELAAHAGAVLGPQILEREQLDDDRRELLGILAEGRLTMAFQPVVDLGTGAVVGYEALARFDDPLTPGDVFPRAARLGLTEQFELACARRAVELARQLPRERWVSINLSPAQLEHPALPDLFARAGRPIVVEVTEHTAVADYDLLRAAVAELGPGVRLSIDDAGAGYASLRHVVELRAAFVKLDYGLVHGIDADPAREALLAGMVYFAEQTGTILIAEGVETEAEERTVRELGVPLAQGFRYARALPAPEAARLGLAD